MNETNTTLDPQVEQAPAGRLFTKPKEALAFLKGRGFKLGKTKFYDDCRKGLIPTDADGRFEEKVLMAYAAALPTLAKDEDVKASDASRQRMQADAAHKEEQALLARMRRLKLEGELMPRADVERDLAARGQFFKAQVENFAHLVGPQLIDLVGGDQSYLPEFLRFWESATADWMDAWSEDREFVAKEDPGGDAA